jgi:F420-dependent oxidoreductase-like protein
MTSPSSDPTKPRFGVHTGLQNTSVPELRDLWTRIEALGFDWISIWDHFYAADAAGGPVCLEAVAAHAALAATTTRVECGSLVYSVGYRHPAVLANAMCTLDQLSNGRIAFGLGAGWADFEYRAYGIPYPPVPVRMRQLEEALQCVTGLLRDDVTNFAGEYFTLTDAQCEPKPVQAHLPIFVGGGGEKVTLRLAARYADGWNVPFVSSETYAHKVAVLHDHCDRIGRDPAAIRKTVNVGLAWSEESLEAQFGGLAPFLRPGMLLGTADEMIARVREFHAAGAETVILALRAPFDPEALDRFAAEVMPAFA